MKRAIWFILAALVITACGKDDKWFITGPVDGPPAIEIAPTQVEFGLVLVGRQEQKNITIRNTGGRELAVTARFDGVPGPFGLIGAVLSVPPHEERSLAATFTPGDESTFLGEIILGSNDPARGSVRVRLRGTGSRQGVPPDTTRPPPVENPRVAVFPTDVEFGTVRAGIASERSLTIQNIGTGRLTGTIRFDAFSGPFAFTQSSFTLTAGQSASIPMRFAPGDASTFTAEVLVESNDPTSPRVRVRLRGTGQVDGVPPDTTQPPPTGSPRMVVNPSSVLFGTARVGQSASREVVVQNIGGGTLAGTVRFDVFSGPFQVSPNTFSLGPGERATFTATFMPTDASTFTSFLLIQGNDPTRPVVSVELRGTGDRDVVVPPDTTRPPPTTGEPRIEVTPPALGFGTVPIGGAGSTQNLTIRNIGGGALTGTVRFDVFAGPFSLTQTSFALGAGETTAIPVRFMPPDASTYAAVLLVESTDPTRRIVSVNLSGTGQAAVVPPPVDTQVPRLVVTPAAVAFGGVQIGILAEQEITIGNQGNAFLDVNLVFDGTAPLFTLTPIVLRLAPGASERVRVTFRPEVTGPITATLRLISNDPSNLVLSIPISGTGLAGDGGQPPAGQLWTTGELRLGTDEVYPAGSMLTATMGEIARVTLTPTVAGSTIEWFQGVGGPTQSIGSSSWNFDYTIPNTTFVLFLTARITAPDGRVGEATWRIQVLARP